jgi:hypothetical protein
MSNMKHYLDPTTGDRYWILPEDEPKEHWILQIEDLNNIPLPDPNYKPPYNALRANEYPSIGNQLDMLWHMMDDETIPGKNSEWYNTIAAIKDKYPKPA